MKNRIYILTLFLLLLVGCKKNYSTHFLKNDSYVISNDQYLYGIEFACDKKIEEFKVLDTTTTLNRTIEYSFVDEENAVLDYYLYGIVFDINNEGDFIFNSFKININNEYEEIIELNMNVYYVEKTNDENILPLSVPIMANTFESTTWCFLVKKDIIIKRIELIPYSSSTIYLNSLLFNGDTSIGELEKIYIDIDKETLEVSRVCISILYMFEDTNYTYISDFSTIGNSLELLKGEINK